MGMPQAVFSLAVNSGVTTPTNYVDVGHSWKMVYLEIPTMASGGPIYIKGSTDTVLFRRVVEASSNTDWVVASNISGKIIPCPVGGIRYLKVETTSGTTDVITTFKIICGD
jgi:hypothetical protein